MSHREKENTEEYKKSDASQGGTVGALRNRGHLPILLEICARSIYPKRHQNSVHFIPVALCAIDTSVHCV